MIWSFYLLLLVFIIVYLWKDTRKSPNFPPGPRWLPLIGNLLTVKKLASIHKFHYQMWQHLSDIYGSVVGLKVGRDKIIIVSGKAAIKEFYSRDEFDGRPDGFFFRVRSFDKRLGIVFVDNQQWEVQRKFSMKTLKQLGMGKNGMVQHVEREAAEMIEFLKEKSENQQPIEMHNVFDVAVLNVMWTFVAGKRFNLEDKRLEIITKLIHDSFRIIDMSGGILNQFPAIRHIIPNKCGYMPLVNTLKPLWTFLLEAIEEIKLFTNVTDGSSSLIEAFLREMELENRDHSFTEEQLLALSLDLFQAGSETTSNTLGFGLIYMLHHPEVAQKVQKELDDVISANRLPCLYDRVNLPYTEAVISEIQRISNVAPLGIAHRALSKCTLGRFVIPENTISIVSLYSLHMDKAYWRDPEVFRPERFFNECEKKVLLHNDYFIPFGSGKRRCMGENLAKSSLFLFFASFMHSFDMILPETYSELPDKKGLDGITLSPKPFSVVLKERCRE